eukprot:COSAG02_NODE_5722_length_4095_cov_5.657908_4_plen_102_part_00
MTGEYTREFPTCVGAGPRLASCGLLYRLSKLVSKSVGVASLNARTRAQLRATLVERTGGAVGEDERRGDCCFVLLTLNHKILIIRCTSIDRPAMVWPRWSL